MKNKYYPSVIIGLGGTGIKALRLIKAIAEHKDTDLKKRLANGSIQLLGIDTDPKSNNRELALDANLVQLEDIKQSQNEEIPRKIPLLENWVLVERRSINDALPKVHETLNTMNADDGGVSNDKLFESVLTSHESIARWFPPSDLKTGSQITMGHSKMAGAAQWRPLGRMALFLEAQKIFDYLQAAVKKVTDESREHGFIRAYIVCSLAGGTGSGMFWDVAFMLQMIEREIRTLGFFLLADPFESVDEAGRLYPNTYAALKEMTTLKNMRLKNPLQVHYPIGESGKIFEAKPQGSVIFDMIYLSQSYSPGFGVSDHNKATIDVTCYRMAQNIMAQLRTDLHSELDVGANNMNSDVTAMPLSREASFAFSTSATTQFTLSSADNLKEIFFREWLNRIKLNNKKQIAVIAPESEFEFEKMLGGDIGQGDVVKQWCRATIQKLVQNPPEVLMNVEEEFQTGLTELAKVSDKISPKKVFKTNVREHIRQKWQEFPPGDECPPVALSVESIDGDFSEIIGTAVNDLVLFFKEKTDQFLKSNIILTDTLLRKLKRLLKLLQKNAQATLEDQSVSGSAEHQISLERPVTYSKAYNYLNDLEESRIYEKTLTNLAKRKPHAHMLVKDIFSDLLSQVKKQKNTSQKFIESAFYSGWNIKRAEIIDAIQAILEEQKKRELINQESKKLDKLLSESYMGEGLLEVDEGQVQALTRATLPESYEADTIAEWYEKHCQELADELDETIQNFRKNQTAASKQSVLDYDLPCRHMEKLQEALRQLVTKNKEYDSDDIGAEAYQTKKMGNITDYLESLIPIESTNVSKSLANKVYFEIAKDLIGNIIEYWIDHSNILLQKTGGEEGLRQRLIGCRSEVFRNGVIENRLKKRHLVIIPPKHTREKRAHLYQRDMIKKMFRNTSQEVMQINPSVASQGSDMPIIYYDDLFRSAEEINKISDYYSAYTGFGQTLRRLFHVNRDWVEFEEVVGEGASYDPIYCGNPDCDFDVRRLPRNITICPKCDNPIWNRCGNEDCPADNVYEIIKKQQGKRTTKYPFNCPECGGELKNYWWECPEHHSKVPMDKEICPYCLAEYQADKRSEENIGRRGNLSIQHCPGCLKLGLDDSETIKIPQPLVDFYHDGVNGHDTLHFKQLIKEYKFHPHLCNFRGKSHFIFPTCPVGEHSDETRHHLFKNENDKFFCMKHPHIRFFTCSQCGYPIEYDKDNDYSEGKIQCPRCFSELKKCYYCSDKYERFYAPVKSKSMTERCPNCYNLMDQHRSYDQKTVVQGIKNPAFCRNIFVCTAASELWNTSSNYDIKSCRVCPEHNAGENGINLHEVSYLLPRENLTEYVCNCPLCLVLLGVVNERGEFENYTGDKIKAHFKSVIEQGNTFEEEGMDLGSTCRICGTRPADILAWMSRDGYLWDMPQKSVTREEEFGGSNMKVTFQEYLAKEYNTVSLPQHIEFKKALEILITIYETKDDRDAYNKLKRHFSLNYMLNNFKMMRQEIMSVFDRSFITVLGLNRRFEALEKYNADILERERQEI